MNVGMVTSMAICWLMPLHRRVEKLKSGHYANICDSAGQPDLRVELSKYVSGYAGIQIRPEQIFILSPGIEVYCLDAK